MSGGRCTRALTFPWWTSRLCDLLDWPSAWQARVEGSRHSRDSSLPALPLAACRRFSNATRSVICVLISAIALVAVSIVAVADHRSKEHRMRRASIADWSCTRRGVRCDEEEPRVIEERWNRRERIYQTSVALLVVIGTVSFLLPAVRPRSSGD